MKARVFFKGQDALVIWGEPKPRWGHETDFKMGRFTFGRNVLGFRIGVRWHVVGLNPFSAATFFRIEHTHDVNFDGHVSIYATWRDFVLHFPGPRKP